MSASRRTKLKGAYTQIFAQQMTGNRQGILPVKRRQKFDEIHPLYPTNMAKITVINPATPMAILLMAPSMSPICRALVVPSA